MTKYSDESHNIRIELDTENCELSPGEIAKLERALSPLREPVKDFPVTDLYVTIQYKPPSHDFCIKTVLQLPGRAMATGDVDEEMYPAFRRCVRKLVHRVSGYKERMEGMEAISKHEKGTRHDVVALRQIDHEALDHAVQADDYTEFRILTYPFEEPVRKRIGRWIQRYPRIEAQLGRRFDLADLVEEVFLNAFERCEERSREVPFGAWLEGLIDPSVVMLSEESDEELSNVRFARTAVEAKTRQRNP
jgi:ribosome-associated translation inhibitor RaiA